MKKIKVLFNESNRYIIQILRRRNIDIYNINDDVFTINTDDLDKIPKYYIKEIKYTGLEKYKRDLYNNRLYILLVIIGFLLMILCSHMILKVEIMHNDKDLRNLVREYLKDNGISPFTFRKPYKKVEQIKNSLKKTYSDEIDWIEIEREGVVYKVKLEEKIIVKNTKQKPLCDIISTKDASILSMGISRGEIIKDLGDFVSKGETIVSGTVKFNEEATLQTCAEGEIYGNTWYKINVNMPLDHKVKKVTKRRIFDIGVERGSKYTRIFKIHFDNYDITKHKLLSFGRTTIYFESVNEYKVKVKRYNKKDAVKYASNKAKIELKKRIGTKGVILSEKVLQSDIYNSIMYIEFFYSVSEPIGKQVIRELPKKGVKEDEVTK